MIRICHLRQPSLFCDDKNRKHNYYLWLRSGDICELVKLILKQVKVEENKLFNCQFSIIMILNEHDPWRQDNNELVSGLFRLGGGMIFLGNIFKHRYAKYVISQTGGMQCCALIPVLSNCLEHPTIDYAWSSGSITNDIFLEDRNVSRWYYCVQLSPSYSHCLPACLTNCLTDWLTDWLTDSLTHSLTHSLIHTRKYYSIWMT